MSKFWKCVLQVRWSKCPTLIKNFYSEHPDVTSMTPEQVILNFHFLIFVIVDCVVQYFVHITVLNCTVVLIILDFFELHWNYFSGLKCSACFLQLNVPLLYFYFYFTRFLSFARTITTSWSRTSKRTAPLLSWTQLQPSNMRSTTIQTFYRFAEIHYNTRIGFWDMSLYCAINLLNMKIIY